MSYQTVWMSVVVLSACSSESDSTQRWTALVESKEMKGMSIAAYADLDLAEGDEATFGARAVLEAEGIGVVETMSVPATWERDGEAIVVHIDETVVPMKGVVPAAEMSCEAAAPESLECTYEGTLYTFEEREEEPVPEERWTLVESTYGSETQSYPIETTVEDADGSWDSTTSVALLRDGSEVTMSMTNTLSGGGALYRSEARMYGSWIGDEQPQLVFETDEMGFECESDGDEMTCLSGDSVTVWERE